MISNAKTVKKSLTTGLEKLDYGVWFRIQSKEFKARDGNDRPCRLRSLNQAQADRAAHKGVE